MKITNLAALVLVRNHILTVINDKSVTNRDEFKPLNEARLNLDKKFVKIIKDLDIDAAMSDDYFTVTKIVDNQNSDLDEWKTMFENSPNIIIPTTVDNNISLATVSSSTETISKDSEIVIEQQVSVEETKKSVEEERKEKQKISAKDPEISAAIARQKEELSKQGRSNKKAIKND